MSPRQLLLCLALFVAGCLGTTQGHAQVVINEFAYDDSGVDDEEFVELFNAGDGAVDLSGWYLATGGSDGPGPRYFLPPDTVIGAGDHLVVGSAFVPQAAVVLAGADIFGNGASYIVLVREDGEVADGVAYETNKGVAGFPEEATAEGGIWGNHVLVAATHLSWQRWFDGLDSQRNEADFGHLPWTPGASNDRLAAADFESDFEDRNPDESIELLPGSFVPGQVIDPAMASSANPNAIPESPDGGLALIAWDPAGGGNLVVLEATPAADMFFEAWVYLDARLPVGDESQAWSIGLRGTSGTFYNLPLLFDANGNTGVTWTYLVTASGATLYLVDEGLGGPGASRVRLGEIAVRPGENDGWQRLRLEVRSDRVTGHFGGAYGSLDDGVRIEGELREATIGSFYIGFREALADNSAARPPTLDSLVVGLPPSGAARFRRGNVNADAALDLADAVFLLNHLFRGRAEPTCLKAADLDDDGAVLLTDAVSVLNYLFRAGAAPREPFTACGNDPTADGLTCDAFPPCG